MVVVFCRRGPVVASAVKVICKNPKAIGPCYMSDVGRGFQKILGHARHAAEFSNIPIQPAFDFVAAYARKSSVCVRHPTYGSALCIAPLMRRADPYIFIIPHFCHGMAFMHKPPVANKFSLATEMMS